MVTVTMARFVICDRGGGKRGGKCCVGSDCGRGRGDNGGDVGASDGSGSGSSGDGAARRFTSGI